ncbi:hypothetical protein AOLI_G00257060 [Acnodon oligacanthus]
MFQPSFHRSKHAEADVRCEAVKLRESIFVSHTYFFGQRVASRRLRSEIIYSEAVVGLFCPSSEQNCGSCCCNSPDSIKEDNKVTRRAKTTGCYLQS